MYLLSLISLAFAIYLKHYSEDYLISILLFIVLGIMGFCMAGMRQAIAIGILMFAYRYARERRLFSFLLCCLIAFGFHNSSLVFIFIYPLLAIKKINLKFWIAFGIALGLGSTRNPIVRNIASLFFTQDRYEFCGSLYTSSLNYTMLIIYKECYYCFAIYLRAR